MEREIFNVDRMFSAGMPEMAWSHNSGGEKSFNKSAKTPVQPTQPAEQPKQPTQPRQPEKPATKK